MRAEKERLDFTRSESVLDLVSHRQMDDTCLLKPAWRILGESGSHEDRKHSSIARRSEE